MKIVAAVILFFPALAQTQPRVKPAPQSEPPKTQPAPKTRVNAKVGLTYVWIPPGTFMMGCSPGDSCENDEKPQHKVLITRGFWIGQTEVTQAAYQRVIGNNPSQFKGPSLPVEMINWEDAQAYCSAVGSRLPTEAEWEYAARGGNASGRYGAVDAVAWHSVNSGNKTHEVAGKQPNGFGLYDMLGNVGEWVADFYDAKYYASSPTSDPPGPASGTHRILRGGTWEAGPGYARVSVRSWIGPGGHYYYAGVRCVSG